MKLKGISDQGLRKVAKVVQAQIEEDWRDEHYNKMLAEFEDALAEIVPRISDTLPVDDSPEEHEAWLRGTGEYLARLSWAHDKAWQALTGKHFRGGF